jgi:N-acetylmuramoyl-L-alanine amidase
MNPAPVLGLLLLLAGWASAPHAMAATPAAKPLADVVAAVDVGHSLKRSGAASARGVPEYRFNLELARLVVAELHKAGIPRAFLIDEAGTDIPPAGRAALANRKKADILISIHHDSVQPHYLSVWPFEGRQRKYCDRFAGYSLFVSAKNPAYAASQALGRDIGDSLRQAGFAPTLHHAEPIPGENRELLDAERGLYRYDGLAVLHRADMPAVLVEGGVIVNRDEETALADPQRRSRMAQAIAQAIVQAAGRFAASPRP